MKKISLLLIAVICITGSVFAENTIVISVTKTGTVNWLLESIKRNGLDKKYGFEMKREYLANPAVTRMAVLKGNANIAVADWIWISIQRNKGQKLMYMPYSSTIGGIMVDPKKNIKTLQDIKGKKLGIAGGASDKGWLLIRALSTKKYGKDIDTDVEKFFGSPPLLMQKIKADELDGIITYWHYASALKSLGFKELYPLEDLYADFGFKTKVPMLGFMFREEWAKKNPKLPKAFQKAYTEAQALIKADKKNWDALSDVIKPKNEAHDKFLYEGFVNGMPGPFGKEDIQNAQKLFEIFYQYGDKKVFGNNDKIDEALFYY